jgi:hypothetical protein
LLILQCSGFVALTVELGVVRQALSEDKAVHLATDQTLADEKAIWQTAE